MASDATKSHIFQQLFSINNNILIYQEISADVLDFFLFLFFFVEETEKNNTTYYNTNSRKSYRCRCSNAVRTKFRSFCGAICG